jgi:secreted trypsin-like serine protease
MVASVTIYDIAGFVVELFRARSVKVYLGAQDTSQAYENGRQTFQSTRITNHQQYNDRNIDNDIAVVRLPSPASLTCKQLKLCTKPVARLVQSHFVV